MKTDTDKIEKIIKKHGSYIEHTGDEITEGISQGIKEGVSDGLKRGVKDALQECLAKGFMNISQDDIQDILKDIPQEPIKNSVKEGARLIFEEGIEDYIRGLCQKLVDRIQKESIRLNKKQTGHVVDFIKRTEQEAMNKVAQKLPNNIFIKEAVYGIQTAIEESLENHLRECEGKIHMELGSSEKGSGGNDTII